MTSAWFLRFGVIFALIGIALGIYMGKAHDFTLMTVHAHINLVGWVSFFLAGLFYAVRPAADNRLAVAHIAAALPGMISLTTGIFGSVTGQAWGPPVAILGAFLVLAGFLLFTINVFRHGEGPRQA
jgi:hypothetical protein